MKPLARTEPDEAVMARLRAGDAGAFGELIGRHLGAVASFSYRMMGNAAEADDIAQETFLRLWRHRDAWEPRAQLRTWLFRIARNLCVDRFRRREVVTAEFPDVADERISASGEVQRRQVEGIIAAALGALPERQRAAIGLVYYEGLSNIEAAEILDVSVDAIESLLARGRRTLRERLVDLRPHLGEE